MYASSHRTFDRSLSPRTRPHGAPASVRPHPEVVPTDGPHRNRNRNRNRLFTLTARTDETDAVRRTPAGDVSVPINMAYNHHHDVYLTGKHSQMADVPYDPLDVTIPMMARSNPHHLTLPVETSASPLGLPTSLHLADGNGGECTRAPSLCSPRLL
jgi:hypothetical protein